MIVLKDDYGLEKVIADNPTSKIGRFFINLKMFEKKYSFHQGHKDIITALRDEGCDIIVFEVFNFRKLEHDSGRDNSYVIGTTVYNHTFTINSCKNYLDVDYLVFATNKPDIYKVTNEIKEKVNNRLIEENYQINFQLTEKEMEAIYYLALWGETRPISKSLVYAYPLNGNFYFHAWKQYKEKYFGDTIILVPLTCNTNGLVYTNSSFYLSFINENLNKDILEFSKYINKLSDKDWKNEQMINLEAFNLGGTIQYRIINFETYNAINIKYIGKSNGQVGFDRIINND